MIDLLVCQRDAKPALWQILVGDFPVAKIPHFVSLFNHLSDSASFFACFGGPETAPAITG
jgi:hypothetical protein